jgi:hypothetical protein
MGIGQRSVPSQLKDKNVKRKMTNDQLSKWPSGFLNSFATSFESL